MSLMPPREETGQDLSFEELVRCYKDSVFRLAVSILGPGFTAEAEEVTQDVFLRVHRERGSFRGESKFSTWLYRIAWNRAFDVKQRARYRLPHLDETAIASRADTSAGPLEQLNRKERLAAIHQAIVDLPEVYQTVIRLHYWLGTGVAEIGELIGAPEGTVKSYLYRARRLLKQSLPERGVSDE